ncbi:C69 family dipeptidase [Streptococcus sinensis]|nr:C69 family dipeptidase [Streptococcus sinensis]
MKKLTFKVVIVIMVILLLPIQAVQACCGFIIGRQLTKDGTTLFGRTEDYPYYPNGGKHNKNYVVVDAKTYNEGDQIQDESNGFTYPHAASEMRYTATYDSARGDGSNGAFGEHGFNEAGVSMTATVSASPNKQVLATDPLKADGLPEAAMLDVILPRVKTAREGVELLAKVIEEKGSAEGNIVVFADQNETWYMEILSGHQYVAVKVPEDKYAVFANTYYLGHVDLTDTENVIASKDVEKVAKESGNYQTDKDGNFHIAKSYGPAKYAEGDRSRTYAGITLLDPKAKVTYEDDEYELFRSPSDPNKKYTLEDAFAFQRNRFEHLNGRFVQDDQIGVKKQGDDGSKDEVRQDQYKYALGNENVIDAHVYQINPNLPKTFGGTVWLGLGPSRNTPYVPFYGNVKDTYQAFKPRTETYDPNSWYWTVWHIDQMAINNQDLFGKSIQNHWKALEEQLMIEQKVSDAKYAALKADEAAAKDAEDQVTTEALARSERLFKQFKQYEAELSVTLKEAGRTDDPYRASLPDDYKYPADEPKPTEPSTEPSKDEPKPTEPSTEPSKDEPKPTVPTTNGRPVLPTNSYILIDPATGIILQNPDFAQGGFSLVVGVLSDVAALKGKDYKAYDIQLSNQNGPVHQISSTVVTIPVDPNKEVEAIAAIGEDGKLENYQFTLNADKTKVTFTTNHFSTYGVVYKSAPKVTQKENDRKLPSTGQTMSMVGVIGGVLLSALGFVFYLEKRRNHKA